MHTDLTFFTNEPDASLLDRFKTTLTQVQYFDVLVGYFRTSGFHLLADALEDVEHIRILVGLSVDRQAFEIIDAHQPADGQGAFAFMNAREVKDAFGDAVADELAHAPDAHETETGVRQVVRRGESSYFAQAGRCDPDYMESTESVR